MSVLLAMFAALLLIIGGSIRDKKRHKSTQPVLLPRYVHPGHTWMRLTEDGEVLVGVDEFAQSVIGDVDGVKLPRLLKKVKQGKVAWEIRHGEKTVPLVSPVTGWVIQKNESVINNPGLINSSPYGDGWLLRIHPRKLPFQLANLFMGARARELQDMARAQLARLFSATPALMYQDGGVMVKNLSERCSEAEWQAIRKEIFLADDAQNTM